VKNNQKTYGDPRDAEKFLDRHKVKWA